MMIVTTLTPTGRYFTDREEAFSTHYTEGGTLWKRKPDAPACVKPWANGDLPESRLDWFEPVMIDGRKP